MEATGRISNKTMICGNKNSNCGPERQPYLELGEVRIESDEGSLALWIAALGETSALCGPAWHRLPLSPSPCLIVLRQCVSLPLCSHQTLSLSLL